MSEEDNKLFGSVNAATLQQALDENDIKEIGYNTDIHNVNHIKILVIN